MVELFKDDMHRDMYTNAFLNDVRYYDSLCGTKEALDMLRDGTKRAGATSTDIVNILSNWDKYASTRGYKCLPIEDFFYVSDDSLRRVLSFMNSKYNIPSYGNERLFVHLYDIQKNICRAGVKVVSKKKLSYADEYSDAIILDTYGRNRYVIKLVDNGNASKFVVVKFKNSIGLFDTVEYKMIAYKNFETHKEYGEWSPELEKELITIYNVAVGIKKNKDKNDNAQESTESQNKKKRLHECSMFLTSKIDRMSDYHKVDKVKIRSAVKDDISEDDIDLLNHYMEIGDLANFERLARKLYAKAFIRLVNYKEINSTNVSDEADDFYCKLTGNRLKAANRKASPRDREYRKHKKRGILENSRGEYIEGGNNTKYQSQVSIKMNDDDFLTLCRLCNVQNPNQSELNGMIEDILYAKFDSQEQYSLRDAARIKVLYNRDKRAQSKVGSYKTCYLPSEYVKYIERIQLVNNGTDNFKNSRPFVVSVILHEFIGYI